MKRIMLSIFIGTLTVLLTGCLYPEDRLAKNQIPYEDQLQSVQKAVIDYRLDTGVLPIENKDQNTPIYIKYPIDFGKLVPRYLPEPPGNSYQNGGIFQYVLINVEKDPLVKLVDLRTIEIAKDFRLKIRLYLEKHDYLPYEDVLANGRYTIDYKKLGYDTQPVVQSPYTGNNLPLFVDETNTVHIDYAMDLYDALKKKDHSYQPGDDIRNILVKDSMFVPAYSVPYTIENGEPVFLLK